MKLLPDTHAFLWFVAGDGRLSDRARRAMERADAELLLSAACVWEMAIKVSIGKLDLPEPVETYVPTRMARQGITPLPVTHAHALKVSTLPPHHRDPFDRLLVAQAMLERLSLLTADPVFARYGINLISA